MQLRSELSSLLSIYSIRSFMLKSGSHLWMQRCRTFDCIFSSVGYHSVWRNRSQHRFSMCIAENHSSSAIRIVKIVWRRWMESKYKREVKPAIFSNLPEKRLHFYFYHREKHHGGILTAQRDRILFLFLETNSHFFEKHWIFMFWDKKQTFLSFSSLVFVFPIKKSNTEQQNEIYYRRKRCFIKPKFSLHSLRN